MHDARGHRRYRCPGKILRDGGGGGDCECFQVHADDLEALVWRAVTDALMRVSLETDVPVLHEVLAIKTEAEARARCMGTKLNRGREAAEAALALVVGPRAEGKR